MPGVATVRPDKDVFASGENVIIDYWAAGAAGYKMWVARGSTMVVDGVTCTGNTKNLGALSAGDYRIQMKAYNDVGVFGPTSNVESFTVEPTPVSVYRFYNFKQGVHFYTTSEAEKANLEGPNGNWTFRFEGNAFKAQTLQVTSAVPVYRFYNFKQGAHFYTTNEQEKAYLVGPGGNWTFRYEGKSFYAYPETAKTGKSPVYRFYNFRQGVHFYTTNPTEKANLESSVGNWTFRYEGIAYYVPK